MSQVTSSSVVEWAKDFLNKAKSELTPEEVKEQKKFASLVQTPEYKTFLSKMLDESSQIRNNSKLNKRVRQIIREYGIPENAREGSYGHYAETMRFRSISPMLAWQEQSKAFLDPTTYLITDRQASPFDNLIRVQSGPNKI